MNRDKANILDHYQSAKVLSGPSATPAGAEAAAALKHDPRYVELTARLDAAGFFRRAEWDHVWRTAVILGVVAAGWIGLVVSHALWLRLVCMAAVGFMVVQSAFLAHEAAHGAVTRRAWLVELLGQVLDTLLVGYNFAYFRRSHDLHHFHTNEEVVDPDQLSDLFSVNEAQARTKRGLGRFISRSQAWTIPFFYATWAFFMRWDGLTYLWRNRRRHPIDVVVQVAHVGLWLVVPSLLVGVVPALVAYTGWSVVAGYYLAAIIPVNHVAMPAIPPTASPSFIDHQVATCRNIAGPRILDHLFIGLNSQIEHHLYPFVPTCRLRAGRAITRDFCREHGLPYHEVGYARATADVFRHFAAMGRIAAAAGKPAPAREAVAS